MLGLSNIFASFLILITVLLLVLTIFALIGWWRGVDSVLFPGIGIVAAMPVIIFLLLIISIVLVVITSIVKPKNEPINNAGIAREFEYPHDIFNGCGNGTLTLSLRKSSEKFDKATDRTLRICINSDDIYAIQDSVIPGGVNYGDFESFEQSQKDDETNRKIHEKFASVYPLIGRINDMYEDYIFAPEEITKLREECLELQTAKPNAAADLALRKLIYASDKALKDEFYLKFTCD